MQKRRVTAIQSEAEKTKEVKKSKRAKFLEKALPYQIPALPQHVRTVLSLGTAREITAQRISMAILRDYGLTLRVYRVLNSAFYSPGRRQVLSMRFITVLIGLDNLARIISPTPLIPVTNSDMLEKNRYALIAIAQSLFAAELAGRLSYNYRLNSEKIVPCTMLMNLGRVMMGFITPSAYKFLVEHGDSEINLKKVKRATGWTPESLGITLAQRWNFPDLIVNTMYSAEDISKTLSVTDRKIIIFAHAINNIVGLASKRNATEKQKNIHEIMKKKFGVSQKGISKAFQEGIKDFSKENGFFYELLEKNSLLSHLLI